MKKRYCADLLGYDQIVVDLKAMERHGSREESQIINYLNASGFRVGLLINFGVNLIKDGISRVVNKLVE